MRQNSSFSLLNRRFGFRTSTPTFGPHCHSRARLNINRTSRRFRSMPGVTLPKPSKDTYDAHLTAQQSIMIHLGIAKAIERAQTAESQARVRTALYSINESVNTAFFTALRSQSQIAELQTTITDLEAQLAVADARVRAGTALPSESDALRAELFRRRQTVAEQVRHAKRLSPFSLISSDSQSTHRFLCPHPTSLQKLQPPEPLPISARVRNTNSSTKRAMFLRETPTLSRRN